MMLTQAMLAHLWPHAGPTLRDAMVANQEAPFALADISTPLRLAHFMAQCSHECGAGLNMVESLSYSAERMMQVWPSRFPTLDSAIPYAHNQKALGNKVYNGRMGNRLGSDDGYTYRGRGLLQETGHDEYVAVGMIAGLDLVHDPDLASLPDTALLVACASWKIAICNPAADVDNVTSVTRKINGGIIGLPERRHWLMRWKAELGLMPNV